MDALESAIAGHPFTKGMSPRHLQVLAGAAMEVSIPAGDVIFRQGDAANRFYLLTDGEVAIESRGPGRTPVLIQTVRGGEVLGWSWLFPPYEWNFDARATRPTRAIFFYGTWLRETCEEDREFGYELIKRVSEVMLQRLQLTRRQLAGHPMSGA